MATPAFTSATPVGHVLRKTPTHRSANTPKCVIEQLNKLSINFSTEPQAAGSFGEVFFGTLSKTNEPVVLKRPRPTSLARTLFRTERIINEKLDTATPLHWPKFLGTHFKASEPYLVWRRVGEGATLEDYLFRKPLQELAMALNVSLGPNDINGWLFKYIVISLLLALDEMHSKGIVHRDVKPANILLAPGRPNALQLIDFGSCADVSNPFWSRGVNTLDPLFAAPEQRLNLFHPQKFDVFSIAMIGIAVLIPSLASESRLKEFRWRLEEADFCLNTYGKNGGAEGDLKPLFEDNAAAYQARFVLSGMLRRDPRTRMSVQRALELLT